MQTSFCKGKENGVDRRTARAKQFFGFNGLRGFDELVASKERYREGRREPLPDQAENIANQLSLVRQGCHLRLTYYNGMEYAVAEGCVTKLDAQAGYLHLDGIRVDFYNVWEAELL